MSNQQYDNRLGGALFKNDRKTSANQPDYRGSITDDNNREFWVSAWIKSGRNGNFLSLALTPKEGQAGSPAPRQGSQPDADDFLEQNRGKADAHRRAHADNRANMTGGPQRPGPQPAADYDSFDDDIPF